MNTTTRTYNVTAGSETSAKRLVAKFVERDFGYTAYQADANQVSARSFAVTVYITTFAR